MIERYSDHAANERTFLAWVRTAIAVMAFGFLVEKFDLFLEIAGNSAGVRAPPGGRLLANIAGLLLIALGGVTMVLAILRFRKTSLAIDSDERRPERNRHRRQEADAGAALDRIQHADGRIGLDPDDAFKRLEPQDASIGAVVDLRRILLDDAMVW